MQAKREMDKKAELPGPCSQETPWTPSSQWLFSDSSVTTFGTKRRAVFLLDPGLVSGLMLV